VGSKLCGTEKSLAGEERLGLQAVDEPGALLHGLVPAPPKIDHQLDTVVIDWMTKNATNLMKHLAMKLVAKTQQDWFDIFLTLFIIINNIEYVCGAQEEFMSAWTDRLRDVSAPPIRSNPADIAQGPNAIPLQAPMASRCINFSKKWLEEWKWSAEKLLHVYRTYFRKKFPFTRGASRSAAEEARLDFEEKAYVDRMINLRGK
jgi:hypothetical protein